MTNREAIEALRELKPGSVIPKRQQEAITKAIEVLNRTDWIEVWPDNPETCPPVIETIGSSDYVLISYSNANMVDIGRYKEDDEGGAFYLGDDETCLEDYNLFVNAWMPLPKPYRETDDGR